MANYAGETFRVTVVSSDFDGQSLVPGDIDEMSVEIVAPDGTTAVEETTMAWSETEELWYFLWDTTVDSVAIDAGAYRIKCLLRDLDGHSSWEYKTVRLKANPS